MKENKFYYSVLTREAQDSIKDPLAIVVYLTLQRHMDFKTGITWISDITASKEAGMSLNSFKRKRKILKELGWITWEHRHGSTNLYKVYVRTHTELTDSSYRANYVAPTELQSNYNIRNYQEVTNNKELLLKDLMQLKGKELELMAARYLANNIITTREYHEALGRDVSWLDNCTEETIN